MYTHEIWDGKTPINGIDAKTMLDNHPEVGGEVVLVKDGNQVVMFQGHDPAQEGFKPLTKARAAELGAELVENLNNPPAPVLSETEQKAALYDQMVEAGVVKQAVKKGHLDSTTVKSVSA